jgi:hypothetical protein
MFKTKPIIAIVPLLETLVSLEVPVLFLNEIIGTQALRMAARRRLYCTFIGVTGSSACFHSKENMD